MLDHKLLLCLGGYAKCSSMALQKYLSYPVTSSLEVLYANRLEYPALPLCNHNDFCKSYNNEAVVKGVIPLYKGLTADYIRQEVKLGRSEHKNS